MYICKICEIQLMITETTPLIHKILSGDTIEIISENIFQFGTFIHIFFSKDIMSIITIQKQLSLYKFEIN